jgi:hypothetical protein
MLLTSESGTDARAVIEPALWAEEEREGVVLRVAGDSITRTATIDGVPLLVDASVWTDVTDTAGAADAAGSAGTADTADAANAANAAELLESARPFAIELRLLIDHSIVEIFAGGGRAVFTRPHCPPLTGGVFDAVRIVNRAPRALRLDEVHVHTLHTANVRPALSDQRGGSIVQTLRGLVESAVWPAKRDVGSNHELSSCRVE